ncbi:peptide ABC transporter substrate-binding protein [Acuticoccus sediminis]|uniref:Peptide ABC transporter substrate-binding protein n=1 Tax=Acuticoccus sediminis TaxID=2184697 RepID=A0A8B2NWX5_9HYPH|nr:oligopeptide/dipeptide ABC transporter ATP-binding protein [Acuticoccus sediminis]RAI01852.1 peptide ABC transporter substrate-binding protein [Acuticoccus sediminis]
MTAIDIARGTGAPAGTPDTAPAPLLSVRGISKRFDLDDALLPWVKGRAVQAVDNVSFDLAPGETLGLVGESGCGKSTLGRLILRLIEPDEGEVTLAGEAVTGASRARLKALRRSMQIVFQNPFGSLNARMSVGEAITEPLRAFGVAGPRKRKEEARRLLSLVGLDPDHADRFPHEFSGGQRQRIAIARAIALEPPLVVCDEAVSALDVSVQAQVLNLLKDLKTRLGMAYLFISHDLAVVRHVSDRVAVMYLGSIVEIADADALFASPKHPYTVALLASVPAETPQERKERAPLEGQVPSPIDLPAGCRFAGRCPKVMPRCHTERPPLAEVAPGQRVACHLYEGAGGTAP